MVRLLSSRWKNYGFLFEELIKRDFKKRYKRTFLGILWSMFGPLLQLLVMVLVFRPLLGGNIPHFVVFVFSGQLIFSFFRESTNQGMQSLIGNSGIIQKIRVPKYLFLLSRNVSSLINLGLTLIIFFFFVAIDGIPFHPRFVLLVYPLLTLMIMNIGIGLILSALFVFFKDVQYLYEIFVMVLMWLSAIFYDVGMFSESTQRLFLFNPMFTHIHYFRLIVLHGVIPAWHIHVICAMYALGALTVGAFFYKRYNYKFAYYM